VTSGELTIVVATSSSDSEETVAFAFWIYLPPIILYSEDEGSMVHPRLWYILLANRTLYEYGNLEYHTVHFRPHPEPEKRC